MTFFTGGVGIPQWQGVNLFLGAGNQISLMYRKNVAMQCGCSILWLSDWTCMQWTLQQKSAFSAVRGGDALFPNDFGEDLLTLVPYRHGRGIG